MTKDERKAMRATWECHDPIEPVKDLIRCLDALDEAERKVARRRASCVRLVSRFKVMIEEKDEEIAEIERDAEHCSDELKDRLLKRIAALEETAKASSKVICEYSAKVGEHRKRIAELEADIVDVELVREQRDLRYRAQIVELQECQLSAVLDKGELLKRIAELEAEVQKLRTTWEPPEDDHER